MTAIIRTLLFLVLTSSSHLAVAGGFSIVDHGLHAGLIIPAEHAERSMPFLKHRFHDAMFYEFGWGDAGFYQAEDNSAWLAMKALFTSTDTVMHVVALRRPAHEFFPNSKVRDIAVAEQHIDTMLQHIVDGFARDGSGRVNMLGAGLYGDSQFYEGAGSYHMFYTCNRWTAEALQAGGLSLDTVSVLTSGELMDELEAAASDTEQ